MSIEQSTKIHGDKLEQEQPRQPENIEKDADSKLDISPPEEHPSEGSAKVHGDKLEKTSRD